MCGTIISFPPSLSVSLYVSLPPYSKSFQSSDMQRSLFGALTPSPKQATSTSKKLSAQVHSHTHTHTHTHTLTHTHTHTHTLTHSFVHLPQRMVLEQGIEEEASEIYVKQEIPFSIELVSNLLDDIRCNLVGQSETIGGQTHLCPELDVTKLDDITSCLTTLRDFVTAWSRDITKNSHMLQEEVRRATVQLADVELQLQETVRESEGVETSLLSQLQVRGDTEWRNLTSLN